MLFRYLLILFLPLLITSCAVKKNVFYSPDLIESKMDDAIPIRVCVQDLQDNRAEYHFNDILFDHGRNYKRGDMDVCINAEKHYKSKKLAAQISKQLAIHLSYMRIFKHCSYNKDRHADYFLAGKLTCFYGQQEPSFGIYVPMGVPSALIDEYTAVPTTFIIEIRDLELYDKSGALYYDFGDFKWENTKELVSGINCWSIYSYMNSALRRFNTDLAHKIWDELKTRDSRQTDRKNIRYYF